MLGIFHRAFANPPKELSSPAAREGREFRKAQRPDEILGDFLTSHHENHALSMTFSDRAAFAYLHSPTHFSIHSRLLCGFDDMYCLFNGSLSNLNSLIRQYGLNKTTNDAMLVIEAYRTLRDRGPYPVDQVLKDLSGSFAFILYDSKADTVFAALGADGGVELYWGIAADGSIVISDDLQVLKSGCGTSFAPFPTGCMFHTEGGLMSYEHPTKKMKAMPRVDSEGIMCGATFKVDMHSMVSAMPRVGSEANWASSWSAH